MIEALIVILVVAVVFMLLLYYLFLMTFAPMHIISKNPKNLPKTSQYDAIKERIHFHVTQKNKEEFEPVYIKSYDNLKLFGRFYNTGKNDVIEIEFHGYRGNAIREFCCGSSIQQDGTISTILVDQRSHGKSKGHAITFGIKERYDVLSWINYVIERFGKDVKIVISGISMGGATVLMASELDLPKNVVAVIADCPYSSPEEIIKKVCVDKGYNPKLVYPFIYLSALIFAGVNLKDSSPISAVQNTNIPVLIIHGDDDRYVPYEMGKQVFESCKSKKRMLTVKGAGHALSYFVDNQQYIKTVNEFVGPLL